jgi:hypothetical protein
MKKLAATLCLSAIAVGAFAQGTVNFVNSSSTLVRTNATGTGGTAGSIGTAASGFYFALYTASSSINSATVGDLLSPTWTFTGLYGANIAAAGRFTGGANVATTTGWAPGVTNSYCIVGWSAGLGAQNINTLSKAAGATLSPAGVWSGSGFGAADVGQFLGISAVGFGAAGGGPTGLPAFSLFGAVANGQGTPIPTGFDLNVISIIPEPSTMALAGLGAAAMVIFRRRKV